MTNAEGWNGFAFNKNIFITKALNNENTKEKQNFVLSNFRVFVINLFWFSACGESELGKGQHEKGSRKNKR
jgi:hypothetical protein